MHIFVFVNLDSTEKDLLAPAVDKDNVFYYNGIPAVMPPAEYLDAEIVFGNIPAKWIEKSQKLRWVQLTSTGYDEYLNVRIPDNVRITNIRNLFGVPVAETVIAGILALFRGLTACQLLKQQKIWKGASLRSGLKTLPEANILILGMGEIGNEIKKRLLPFGVTLNVFRKNPEEPDLQSLAEVDAYLPKADVVIACLPENEETKGLFSQARFLKMKRDALFINVGRGSLIDEDALAAALKNGDLGGALLDVTIQEPLPAGHPFWECPNLILSQHTGGGFDMETKAKIKQFVANYTYFKQTKPLSNQISLKNTY